MEPELLFTFCSRFVMLAWLLLVFAPRWQWTGKLVSHAWIPALLAIAYIYSFWQGWPMPEGGGFSSLQGVMVLFQEPWAVLAGWIHYLAFDLFIGAWEVRDAQRRGINHLLVIPCLLLTFMAGPVGLLLYLCIRFAAKQVLSLDEAVGTGGKTAAAA